MPDFYDYKFKDENTVVSDLIDYMDSQKIDYARIEQQAYVFIETIRKRKGDLKGFNALIQSYDLTSEEGLALMTLAEALLRIPDNVTADLLIQDKLSEGDWAHLFSQAGDLTARLSGMGLSLSQKTMDSMVGKLGMPLIRKACTEAMQLMGRTFVLGRDIEEALRKAKPGITKGYVHNYDMLGEGARTSKDADLYFQSYAAAIRDIGTHKSHRKKDNTSFFNRAGISVKLSALYPRYEFSQSEDAISILSDRLMQLCTLAAEYNINLTVDAEECDRLALSLKIIETVLKSPVVKNWDGFGMAVQAYHKRAMPLLDVVLKWPEQYNCKFSVRLVKGAYWDSEIKHSQIEGYSDYPVFTRKENTDLSYLACACKLLKNRDKLYPMFGTHNAHTVAAIIDMAGDDKSGFMFQRLHGMGEQLYNQILTYDLPVGIYAPVGTHKYLLAYLVRRLLENGANSSFVNKIYDRNTPIDNLIVNPLQKVKLHEESHAHPLIPLPENIFSNRRNSRGLDMTDVKPLTPLFKAIAIYADQHYHAPCIIDGNPVSNGRAWSNHNPSNTQDEVGFAYQATVKDINEAYTHLKRGYAPWTQTPVEQRAVILEKIAYLYEKNTDEIMALLIREAGKTIPDAIAEIREAVDFCRYYAQQARLQFVPQELEGPTGERNSLVLEGRGIFACISPWNFPLAIFTGQIVAALVAGNCVIAKPAEQTPAIATYAVKLMLKAGIPRNAIALLHGGGKVGGKIIAHQSISGVAFTGSTEVAKIIQRALADKDGAILPLIAETGGINAMIVDSTSLPEQVTDDVLHSAFGSAGQRCSALRILCVQDDVADEIIPMIKGAMDHLVVGDPVHLCTDVGPIIDSEAMTSLKNHLQTMQNSGYTVTRAPYDMRLDDFGTFFTPTLIELADIDNLENEAFGPILHIIKFKEYQLEDIIAKLNAKGFGLTFGLHSRINTRQERLSKLINAGNIYINRGQTGAVVGVQPFGGRGLSGTGPKAGGPYYLHAFATEKSVSNNITASGGNATLVNL